MPIRFASRLDSGPGLVVYITVGDPDLATTRNIALSVIDAGADVIELGVPFSDPLADGPVIQRASERALRHGTTLADVLAIAADLRAARPETGLVVFSYYNPILRFGLERFCAAAEQAGVDGVLVTDMIVEEAGEYLTHLERHNLAPIFLAAPTSPDERVDRIAKASRGFVYAI
ncbi:MAG: tryptophan synthase subunit alpha, partial [Acidobacteriaceae bacterium]|nr:tryptophan synthase subunit alpha [Acidobacteriaceae bacterium]